MKWNELFFIDWHPDVIPARSLSVCFHAVAEVRSELATDAVGEGEKMVKKSSVEAERRKEA